ncbi:hypothetical protein DITRI_Ditri16bG0138800 [Diplodiscus trichospermus]
MGCSGSTESGSHNSSHSQYGNRQPPSQQEPQFQPESEYEVTQDLAKRGLRSCKLVVGIDLAESTEGTGRRSVNRQSLHHTGDSLNPYEQAISIIGKILAPFDKDNLIPCFGFGDESTQDHDVFNFCPDGRFCNGVEEVLIRYREIVPHLQLAGPTSFVPIIEMAMKIIGQSADQYYILVIISERQVTEGIKTIVQASNFPMSIILVGVGDGPWDMMEAFKKNFPPGRAFNNFQFVNFTEIMPKDTTVIPSQKKVEFANAALKNIPSKYKAIVGLRKQGKLRGDVPERVAQPPPLHGALLCPNCRRNRKGVAFGCGHMSCEECAGGLQTCPICEIRIRNRITLRF